MRVLHIFFLITFFNYCTGQTNSYELKIPGSEVVIPMVLIQEGSFLLGSDEKNAEPDEKPIRTVMIDGFWMSAFEITHDAYMVFRDPVLDLDAEGNPRVDGITRPSQPYEDPVFGMGTVGYPAAGMTQFGALQFCRWLSDKTGDFYRLPTEAEWEYASRAGTQTPYFFGKKKKDLRQYAWYEKNSGNRFHPVGQLEPNPWGLYDILGNVAEWTLDQYQDNYYGQLEPKADNPWRHPTDLHPRSVRGGSFRNPAENLRCSDRTESTLDWKKRDPQIPKSFWWNTDSPFVGFRIVCPVEKISEKEQEDFWNMVLGG
jgi:formylglycine-generating enzyme required for sulfatase activity